MKRIPREYIAQDHLKIANSFEFNISTDPVVVAERAANRGRHSNIINDQSAGTFIGTQVLGKLKDVEYQKIWAELFAGTMLNSALYMLRRQSGEQPMFRRFKLPGIVSPEGHVADSRYFSTATLGFLNRVAQDGAAYEQVLLNGKPSSEQTTRYAKILGNASMTVAIYGQEFDETGGELAIMQQVLETETQMHQAVQEMAGRIGVNPSLAQLRSDTTPLGSHIVQSRSYPLEVVAAFRETSADVSGGLGY